MESKGAGYVFVLLFSCVAMAIGCFAAFCVFIKGPEQVLVPDVVGLTLEDAIVHMQEKELYARLTLKSSDNMADKGRVLEQSPDAGSIRKGYSRVSLVVSSGPVVDAVANYIGMTVDEVRLQVAAQFAGEAKPLIVIGQPIYKESDAPLGTVLAQEPVAGTQVSRQVTVHLVASRGNGRETVSVPDLTGFTIEEAAKATSSLPLRFDYVAEPTEGEETAGTVRSMEKAGEAAVEVWSHVEVTLAMPTSTVDGKVYGIFEAQLENYPVAVTVSLVAVSEDEQTSKVAEFTHIGGAVTVPYCVVPGTTLELFADGVKCAEMEVK